MLNKIANRVINYSFYTLAFATPLILFTKTSELFEFNKIVATYALSAILVASWLVVMITQKRFIFRRSILDLPLLIFLLSQSISTFLSIDTRTSLLGYYSRFHGGLFSSITYALLYWCYVSTMDSKKTKIVLKLFLTSAVVVSVYAILQKTGIDKNIWVQDVQNRVFSTLGQPNWLAAWITALIPLTWAYGVKSKQDVRFRIVNIRNLKRYLWLALSVTFFLTLLYTKSRSGLLGFMTAMATFWLLAAVLQRKKGVLRVNTFSAFLSISLAVVITAFMAGTVWTPKLADVIRRSESESSKQTVPYGPALEVGGTDSGSIRKIVWRGALDIWKNYPLFGRGPETFAFSFYRHRPAELNLTSEWDYLYNKAHNEYLNFAATTGTVGLLSYLAVISFGLVLYSKNLYIPMVAKSYKTPTTIKTKPTLLAVNYFSLSLLAGFVSILITNFFGFSVVPVALEFYLFPAMAISLEQKTKSKEQSVRYLKTGSLSVTQKLLAFFVICTLSYVLFAISKYWLADYYYAQAASQNENENYQEAQMLIDKATKLSPNEALFWQEYADLYSNIATKLAETAGQENASYFADLATQKSEYATALTPRDITLRKNKANMYILLSTVDEKYLKEASATLEDTVMLAPTDAKLAYNLAISYLRIGEVEKSIDGFKKTIELKNDYRDARYAYALVLTEIGKENEAKKELNYILENIDPEDSTVKRELNELSNP